MKIFKTLSKRGLALFLVLAMCMSLLPTTAIAAELAEDHIHNEDGWVCERGELICGMVEHHHDESCYPANEPESDANAPEAGSDGETEQTPDPGAVDTNEENQETEETQTPDDSQNNQETEGTQNPNEPQTPDEPQETEGGKGPLEDLKDAIGGFFGGIADAIAQTLSALTEGDEPEQETTCGLPEHEHTDDCYRWDCTAPAKVPEGPEGSAAMDVAALWRFAKAYNGRAMNMPSFFGLISTASTLLVPDSKGALWPASVTFVGEDVEEEVLLEDAITRVEQIAVVDENTITFDGKEVTVYYFPEEMSSSKPSWFRDDGMYSIKDDNQDAVTFQFYAAEDATGKPLTKDQILTADKNNLQIPAAPEKKQGEDGRFYVFEKWVELGTETEVVAGAQNLTGRANQTVKVVPVYGEYWHVTFQNADGTVAYVASVKCGEALPEAEVEKATQAYVPETAGNTVDGWTYEPVLDGGKPTSNVIATATAEKTGVWVEFDSDGGTPVNALFPNADGHVTDIPTAETMKKPGYTFEGWYLEDGTTRFTSETKVDSVLKVKAHWKATEGTYTIQYWIEDADSPVDAPVYTYVGSDNNQPGKVGETVGSKSDNELLAAVRRHISANLSEIDNTQFEYDANAKDKTAQANNGVKIQGDGSTIFNVYFSRKSYTLTFTGTEFCGKEKHTHTNNCYRLICGGTSLTHWRHSDSCYDKTTLICGKEEHTHDSSCRTLTFTCKYDQSLDSIWNDPRIAQADHAWNFSGLNYILAYYAKMPGRDVKVTPANRGAGKEWDYCLEAINGVAPNGEPTFTHYSTVDDKTRTYYVQRTSNCNFGKLTYNEEYYDITGFDKLAGRNDEGWSSGNYNWNNGHDEENDGRYRLFYTRKSYDLEFDNGGGTPVGNSVKVLYQDKLTNHLIDGANVTKPLGKENCTFSGWATDPAGKNPVTADATMPAGLLKLYAIWMAQPCEVAVEDTDSSTYRLTVDGGKVLNSQQELIALLSQEVTGFNAEGILGFQQGSSYIVYPFTVSGDVTLKIVRSGENYGVKYETGDGNEEVHDTGKYALGNQAVVKAGPGEDFDYWTVQGDASGKKYYPNDLVTVGENTVLIAHYKTVNVADVTVTYHENDGTSNRTETTTAKVDNDTFQLEGCTWTRRGYTFKGWAKTANATTADYTAEAIAAEGGVSVRVDSLGSNELYAVWQINQYEYTVNHVNESGTTIADPTGGKADYGTTVIAKDQEKAITGYKFKEATANITISDTEANNVITITYEIDESQTHKLSYTVEYYKLTAKQEDDTVERDIQVLKNTLPVDKNGIDTSKYGPDFKFKEIQIGNRAYASVNAEGFPAEVPNGTVIKVIYEQNTAAYEVKYYCGATSASMVERPAPTESAPAADGTYEPYDAPKGGTAVIGTSATATPARFVKVGETCYVLDKVEPVASVTAAGPNTVKVYYLLDDLGPDGKPDGKADECQKKVTFKVVGGNWDDPANKPTEYYEVVDLMEGEKPSVNGSGTVTAPKAGSSPDENHANGGSWDNAAVPAGNDRQMLVSGNSAVTYTYTYPDRATYTVTYHFLDCDGEGMTVTEQLPSTWPKTPAADAKIPHGYKVDFSQVGTTTLDGKQFILISKPEQTIVNKDQTNSFHVYFGVDEIGKPDPDKPDDPTPSKPDNKADVFEVVVTFKVVNGKWDNETTADVVEVLELNPKTFGNDGKPNGTASLTAPGVGTKPDAGYQAGSWSPIAPTTVTKSNDGATYIYTFAPKKDIVYTVKYVDDATNQPIANPVDTSGQAITNPKTVEGQTMATTVKEIAPAIEGYTLKTGEEGEKSLTLKDSGNEIVFAYTINSYGVTYRYTNTAPAEAAKAPTDGSHAYRSEVTVKGNPAEVAGYTFSGWTAPAGVTVAGGTFTMPAEDVEFTGTWSANKATIHFNTLVGGLTVESWVGVTDGATNKDALPTPTRTGYTLEGWYTEQALTNEVTEVPATFPAGETTYYAKWTPKTGYTVNYDLNGGNEGANSGAFNSKTNVSWTQQDLVPTVKPVYPGYTFTGWKVGTANVADNPSYAQLANNNDTTMSVTLTAQWSEDRTQVHSVYARVEYYFGDDLADAQAASVGKTVAFKTENQWIAAATEVEATVIQNGFSDHPGYVYAEASTDVRKFSVAAGEATKTNPDGTNFVNVIKVYYIKQTGLEYTVKYYFAGESVTDWTNATPGTPVVKHDGKYGDPIPYKETFSEIPTEVGAPTGNYVFDHVDKSTSNGVISEIGTNNVVKVYFGIDSWNENDPAGTDPENPGDGIPDIHQAKVTYSIVGGSWTIGNETNVTEDKTFVLTLETKNATTGAWEAAFYEKHIPTEKANLPGYQTTGSWGTSGDPENWEPAAKDEKTFIFTYPKRTDLSYVVNYLEKVTDADGSITYSPIDGKNRVIESNQEFEAQIDVAKYKETITGFKFESISPESTLKISVATGVGVDENANNVINVYYTRESFEVKYEYEGTQPDNAPAVPAASFVKYGDPVPVEDKLNLDGYTFSGWKKDGNLVTDSFKMPAKNVVLKGSFTANSYTVQFNANAPEGATVTGTMDNQEFQYDVFQNLTANAYTCAGYTFQGWAKTADGSKEYSDAQSVGNLTAENGATVTLYAVWQENGDYTVTYNLNGGDRGTNPANTFDDKTGVAWTATGLLPGGDPVRVGYQFNGWEVGETAVTKDTKYSELVTNDQVKSVTLVAQWAKDPTQTHKVSAKVEYYFVDDAAAIDQATTPLETVEFSSDDKWIGDETSVMVEIIETGFFEKDGTTNKHPGYKFHSNEDKDLTFKVAANAETNVNDLTNNVIKVYYIKDSFSYTVEYYFDDVKATTGEYAVKSDKGTFGDGILATAGITSIAEAVEDYDTEQTHYILDYVVNENGTITHDDENTVKIYYAKDMWNEDDPTGEHPEDPGDGIPDSFQAKVTYMVSGGYWDKDTQDEASKTYILTVQERDEETNELENLNLDTKVPGKDTMGPKDANTATNSGWDSKGNPADWTPAPKDDKTFTYVYPERGTMTVTATGISKTYDGEESSIAVTVQAGGTNLTNATIRYYRDEARTEEINSFEDSHNSFTNVVDSTTIFITVTHPDYVTVDDVTAEVVITPKAVTVTAVNKEKVWNDEDPDLEASVSDTVTGEESSIQYELARAAGENVGEYAITVTGDKDQDNYTVSFVNATLTIKGKVSYDANSGAGAPVDMETYTRGTEVTLKTDKPTHEAVTVGKDQVKVAFIGWTTTQDDNIYAKDDIAPTTVKKVAIGDTSVTVYAVWGYDVNDNGTPDVLELKYDLIYDANGGKDAPETVSGNLSGTTVNLTGTATKPENSKVVFLGWSDVDTYSVSNPCDTLEKEKAALKTNVIFATGEDAANITVYAVWAKDENGNGQPDYKEFFTLAYNANGGTGEVPAVSERKYAQKDTEQLVAKADAAENLTMKDAVLLGWSLTKQNLITSKDAEKAASIVSEVTFDLADITVYAVWAEDKNGNSTPDYEDPHYTVTYTDGVDSEEVFKDQVNENVLKDLPTPEFIGTPVRAEYVFAGWEPVVADTVTKDVTYAAQWMVDKLVDPSVPEDERPAGGGDGIPDDWQVTVTFDAVNGTVSFDDTVVTKRNEITLKPDANGKAKLAQEHIPATRANTGYTGGTWAPMTPVAGLDVTDMVGTVARTAGKTFTITYERIVNTITIEVVNGTASASSIYVLYGENSAPITFSGDTGYVLGSATVDGAPVELTNGMYTFYGVVKDHTIRVVYVQGTFTATFVDGQTGDTIETRSDLTTLPAESTYPAAPEHEGYDFIGWTIGAADADGNVTITANYKPAEVEDKTFTVIFTDGLTGETIEERPGIAELPDEGAYPDAPEHEGYDFIGWTVTGPDADGNYTITANYVPVEIPVGTHTVTWVNWNGVQLQQVVVNDGDAEPDYTGAAPVRPSDTAYTYTFRGWSAPVVDADGNVTYTAQYTPSAIVPEGPDVPVGPTEPVTPTPPTVIPDNPVPLTPPTTTITDQDVPLAGAIGLNDVDHFAYVIGYDDDTVRPLNNITRAEVATIFFRLMTDEYRTENWATTNDFSDVKAGSWYNNAISTCAKAGLLTGYPDGTFKPNQSITRAEFAAIAARFLSDEVTGENVGDFSDTANHWAAKEIRRAAEAGWVTGSNNEFRPNDKINRAEVMTIVNRMLDRIPDAEHMLETMKKWTDNPAGTWYYEAVQEATNEHAYERDELGVTETWTEILEARDWKALEAEWASANAQ